MMLSGGEGSVDIYLSTEMKKEKDPTFDSNKPNDFYVYMYAREKEL